MVPQERLTNVIFWSKPLWMILNGQTVDVLIGAVCTFTMLFVFFNHYFYLL